LLSAPFFAGPDAWGLDECYKRSLQRQLEFIIAKHPKYVAGGADDPDKGLDCSGYVYLAAKWAGIPGICRTTSLKMSQGLCGWTGVDIGLDSADVCDLPFWTFEPHRPNGHVGVFLRDPNGWPAATHASSRRGVVLDALQGKLLRDLTKVRRLTIGD
jgi:cell wall-associated NlpC family hydrolase